MEFSNKRPFSQWRKDVVQSKRQKKLDEKQRKKDQFLSDEILYKKIGSSEVYNDTSTEVTYDWGSIISPAVLSSYHETRKLKSLKTLTAMKIAENEHLLNVNILKSSSWQVWKLVWLFIASWRRDSFLIFQLFASVFGNEDQFECHPNVTNQIIPKKSVILKTTLPNSTHHRVERFFSNIRISSFVSSLNSCQFDNMIVLEIAKPMSYDDLIFLTNLKNLTALKIGRMSSIPDPVIARWCSSIKAGKWAKLQILSLPMTSQASFMKLQGCAKDGKLMYLEMQSKTITNIERDWKAVDYDSWDLVKEPVLDKMSWGLKAQTILRKFKVANHTLTPNAKSILLDFNIVNHSFNVNCKEAESEYEQVWKLGELVGHTQAMVLKAKPVAALKENGEVRTKPKNIGKKVISKTLIKGNLKAFFAL
jgi:hypothetical protein